GLRPLYGEDRPGRLRAVGRPGAGAGLAGVRTGDRPQSAAYGGGAHGAPRPAPQDHLVAWATPGANSSVHRSTRCEPIAWGWRTRPTRRGRPRPGGRPPAPPRPATRPAPARAGAGSPPGPPTPRSAGPGRPAW